jgi:hypothetical protein
LPRSTITNNVATSYAGTAHFTSSDLAAALPADSTLTSGMGTFPATLYTSGAKTLAATDSGPPVVTGSANVIVAKANSQTALVPTSTVAYFMHPSVLSVTVTAASGTESPSGTVTLLDGVTPIAQAALDNAGNATFTLHLKFGLHSLTVSYPGDGNFNASASAAKIVRSTPGPFPVP